MDAVRLARYPILPQAVNLVRAEGPPPEDLLVGRAWGSARSQGRERVLACLEGEPVPPTRAHSDHESLVSLLGYVVARLLVSCVEDRMLTNRYATAEARRLHAYLVDDDDEALLAVAASLGVEAARRQDRYAVPFPQYLAATKDLSALEWKLVNRTMDDGQVLLVRNDLVRLVQEAYKIKLLTELPLEVPAVVHEHLETWRREVEARVQEIRSRQVELDAQGVHPTWFPPCIQGIINAIKNGENVSHEGRFAVVAFLNTIGMDRQAIIDDLFSNVPDFARDITEYQVDHILGNKSKDEAYTPPGCGTLQTYGLCPMMSRAKGEWDKWCAHEKMNHPLTYYRWGLFVEEKRSEDGPGDDADGAGGGGDGDHGDAAGDRNDAADPGDRGPDGMGAEGRGEEAVASAEAE